MASELSIDTLDAIVTVPDLVVGNQIISLPSKSEILVEHNGWNSIFYLNKVDRVGKFSYKLSGVSEIGLLDGSMHYGGIYNGIDEKSMAASIIVAPLAKA